MILQTKLNETKWNFSHSLLNQTKCNKSDENIGQNTRYSYLRWYHSSYGTEFQLPWDHKLQTWKHRSASASGSLIIKYFSISLRQKRSNTVPKKPESYHNYSFRSLLTLSSTIIKYFRIPASRRLRILHVCLASWNLSNPAAYGFD